MLCKQVSANCVDGGLCADIQVFHIGERKVAKVSICSYLWILNRHFFC